MPTQVSDQFREALLINVVSSLVRVNADLEVEDTPEVLAGKAESLTDAVIAREEKRLTKDSLTFICQSIEGFEQIERDKEWRKAGVLLIMLKEGIKNTRSAPLQAANAALLGLMAKMSPGSMGSEDVTKVLEIFRNARTQLEADLGIPQ
jgi:hypothetical protein